MPDWHGLPPSHLAYLIRRYTHVGGAVLDLDAHPATIAATAYLRRVPARMVTVATTRACGSCRPPLNAGRAVWRVGPVRVST
ncbi:hypothetical protein [Salinispora arenicola]|uniref:hypothetical protein n=1 Tax=Salinispora arenicola TaxID=168697 RepID=UPI0027DBD1D6|nr:hypothetical protein [Salinispora arenicola]